MLACSEYGTVTPASCATSHFTKTTKPKIQVPMPVRIESFSIPRTLSFMKRNIKLEVRLPKKAAGTTMKPRKEKKAGNLGSQYKLENSERPNEMSFLAYIHLYNIYAQRTK